MTTQTTPQTLRLAIIVGSVRGGRFGPVVARWVAAQAQGHGGFDIDVIDLAEEDLPLELPAESPLAAGESYPRPPEMAQLTERLAAADAFLIVTPEYNHSYPASLKAAIDWHFLQWQAKPVAFVSYGGMSGGRHAVLHLENVLIELHAVPVRTGLSFPMYWQNFGEDGQPTDPMSFEFAKAMFAQLAWWGDALRTARDRVPYVA
ncbi:NADPH-dependent FMN reductase [Luteipulveratus mongoliensis]|uniref:FMN reductase n=1 Tax=Luteipulveratus mongoliensis TaxID=571913 RepID=A0A0K1JE68_9MICO|nr:NAD(P)H-dependent oxidoreductase [Luteipulveratus mongoliensis]AKU15001.1 FMN reductase [Luteipulveratus mongoliensis]